MTEVVGNRLTVVADNGTWKILTEVVSNRLTVVADNGTAGKS